MQMRWALHTYSRHFPDMVFPVERFFFRRSAVRAARCYRSMLSFQLFRYELEDTSTGERTEV